MRSKHDIEDNFEWWITCIPDKINRLEELIPKDIFGKLDYSIESFNVLEEYLLSKYTIKQVKNNPELHDCLASYLGTTYRRNIQKSEWYVELENEKDAFYGIPILRVSNLITFEPHSYVTTLLDRKKGNLLSSTLERHKKYLTEIPE